MTCLELKIPPVAIVIIFGLAMWLSADYSLSFALPAPWRSAICSALFVASGFFGISGVIAFRKARTTVNPTRPETASAMVVSGIYRHTRNPMYLALLLMLIGWATYLSQVLAFLFLPMFVAYMNRFQILPEERALSAKFGQEYSDYLRSVRRWL
jgi:protein-S-isoprenylcysteine O-methyltransferase Ste14